MGVAPLISGRGSRKFFSALCTHFYNHSKSNILDPPLDGLLKRRFRRESVSCLDDLVATVEASGEVNVAELVGREDGTAYIPVYSWSAYLAPHFKRIPKLKQFHHITVTCEAPDTVSLKLAADGDEERLQLLRDG